MSDPADLGGNAPPEENPVTLSEKMNLLKFALKWGVGYRLLQLPSRLYLRLCTKRSPLSEDEFVATGRARDMMWSPDGEWIVYERMIRGPKPQVCKARMDGTEEVVLRDGARACFDPVWSLSGDWIAFELCDARGRSQIWRMKDDGLREERLSPSRGVGAFFDLSPDGTSIVFLKWSRRHIPHLYTKECGRLKAVRVTRGNRYYDEPRWSPDGKSIACAAWDEETNVFQIYDVRLADKAMTQLTHDSRIHGFPRWSPNSRWIAYYAIDSNHEASLCVVSRNGETACVAEDASGEDTFCWSPDSRSICYVAKGESGMRHIAIAAFAPELGH